MAAIAIVRQQEMPIAGLSGLTAINANRGRLEVTSHEYFDLRDDKTASTNLFDHFGLLRDDYTPKTRRHRCPGRGSRWRLDRS